MSLKEIIRNARERMGVENLTPMQQEMAALDVSARESITLIAPTGSGKTLAFALALLQRVRGNTGEIEAVVMAPSRELVLQINKVLNLLAPGLRIVPLYGGHNMGEEKRSLDARTPDVVVATPGRLLDHLQRRNLDLQRVHALVLDEYDKSLDLGFADEMSRLVKAMRGVRLLILTSATRLSQWPDYIDASRMRELDFSAEAIKPELELYNVASAEADKLPALKQLLLRLPQERTLVFVNHRESAERVYEFLRKAGFPATLYHGALEQPERETSVDLFANGTAPIMVATDLAARGLDIPDVTSVIHYHPAGSDEIRTHRNGRAARMGATGSVYYLIGPKETAPESEAWAADEKKAQSWHRTLGTLYFHSGKKEKLSRGDIVGALTKTAGLRGDEIGQIALHEHRALVAIPAARVRDVLQTLSTSKIKGKRIKVTELSD